MARKMKLRPRRAPWLGDRPAINNPSRAARRKAKRAAEKFAKAMITAIRAKAGDAAATHEPDTAIPSYAITPKE